MEFAIFLSFPLIVKIFDNYFSWEANDPDRNRRLTNDEIEIIEKKGPNELQKIINERHDKAQLKGEKMYVDPKTGLFVMTRDALLERGTCCGNKCRHCPYNKWN
ncbi:hypothetical protein M0811_00924 [Anaeramoeba ignava]|uniref:Uncharacterized protein n=1 Tax=Anaeramoeba ignava TaxID=1746090 RepID=A0A9Q0LM51_ANAIG|nr:hypothetical protein M0811_00924 [Anaeramoeba ignava]